MPRQGRKYFVNSHYHVVCRGNRKNDVFWSFDDYNVYLIILGNAKKAYPFKLLSYCLMPNHVHLQIQTEEIELSVIMKYLNQRYSMYFNKEHNLVGRLFQGRYKAVPIDSEAGVYHVSRYVHLNPVKAGMVNRAEDYIWCSYNGYKCSGVNRILDEELILKHFGEFERYDRFVMAYWKGRKARS